MYRKIEQKRFEVSTSDDYKEFKTYKGAFNYYMKVRDDVSWLWVFDNLKQEYLIVENCYKYA